MHGGEHLHTDPSGLLCSVPLETVCSAVKPVTVEETIIVMQREKCCFGSVNQIYASGKMGLEWLIPEGCGHCARGKVQEGPVERWRYVRSSMKGKWCEQCGGSRLRPQQLLRWESRARAGPRWLDNTAPGTQSPGFLTLKLRCLRTLNKGSSTLLTGTELRREIWARADIEHFSYAEVTFGPLVWVRWLRKL